MPVTERERFGDYSALRRRLFSEGGPMLAQDVDAACAEPPFYWPWDRDSDDAGPGRDTGASR